MGVSAADADSVRMPSPHQTAHETLLRPHTLTPIHEHPRGADSAFSQTPSGVLLLLANMDGKALPTLSQRSVDAVVMLLRVVGDSLARVRRAAWLWVQHFDQAAGDTRPPVTGALAYSLTAATVVDPLPSGSPMVAPMATPRKGVTPFTFAGSAAAAPTPSR
jgi:hypothetical protein